jgi:hypothetical protein
MEHGAIRHSIAGAAIAEADRRRLHEPASKRPAAGAGGFGVVNSDRDAEALMSPHKTGVTPLPW